MLSSANEGVRTPPRGEGVGVGEGQGTARKWGFRATIALLLVPMVVVLARETFFWTYAWLPAARLEAIFASTFDGALRPHMVHVLTLSAFHTMVLVGLVAQLRQPEQRVAPIWQVSGGLLLALVTWPFVFATAGFSTVPPPVYVVVALAVAAGLLHPGRPFSNLPRPADRTMTWLWAVATVPAVVLVVTQLRLQLTGVAGDPHWEHLHYQFMAEYGLDVVLIGLLGASTLPGWRISAWSGSLLVGTVGIGSLAFPNTDGSLGTVWGLTMVAWAVMWLAATELRHRRSLPATDQR